jgi:hypothetical protein
MRPHGLMGINYFNDSQLLLAVPVRESWCVATILEQVANLKSANAVLFDIHGEYTTLESENFTHLR